MNKIFKVIYSKTKHCYVVVSELAKSHCKTAGSHTTRNKTALTAAVLLALGTFSFVGMPTAQAEDAINVTNDYIGINTTVYDENGKKENPPLSKRNSKNSNYGGVWSEGPGAITLGVYAGAGQQTVTIGNNNRTHSVGSVYIGEHKDYLKPGNEPKPAYYVTSVGFNADAGGYGSIAIGSNAQATNLDTNIGLRVYQKSDENGNGYGYLENNPTLKGASVAVGYSANAADGNVAIGAYSQALMDDKAKKSLKKKSVYTDEEASSYVSVGGTVTTKDTSGNSTTSTIRRRISNVADGADATDVATVGQLQALSKELGGYKEGFGIEITTDSTDKTKNKISLKRNLGRDANTKDKAVLKADEDKSALVIGGRVNQGDATGGQTTEKDYGALGQDSVTVGGADNTASGDAAVVVGGLSNTSSAQYSTVVGGSANDAIGNESSVFGGFNNDATGLYATISGGSYNRTYGEAASVFGGSMNNAVGSTSSVFGGSINTANGIWSSVVGGSHNTTLGLSSTAVGGENAIVDGKNSVGIAGGSTKADNALAAGNEATVTVNNGTAIGYQATANKEGTVAFGHDKDDVYYTSTWPQKATEKDGKYYDADNKEITEAQYEALRNADTTFNDYSQKPTVTENKYGSAAYNRLVKVADGQDVHDVVVMEQLDKAKTELTKDLSVNAGWGINVADVTTKNNDGTETTTKNVISLNRNLGTNYGNPWKGEGKVTFEAGGENSLILGGAASILFHNEADDVKAGAYGKDSVLVGGFNNLIDTVVNDATQTGEYAVIVGGDTNEVTGQKSVSVGGYKNTVTGSQSVINGGASNIASGAVSSVFGGQQNTASGLYASVFGGDQNEASEEWSSAIGGITNTASGIHAVTLGGENNVAKGQKATTVGGTQNMAIGEWSLAAGGAENTSYGDAAYTAGGTHNMAYGNDSVALGGLKSNVNAKASTGIAGGSTGEKAITALAAGYQSVVTDSGVEWHTTTQADLDAIKQGLPWSGFTYTEDHDPYTNYVLDKISTAVGYQSTADAPGVIAFGHDKGDVASVAKKWKQKATMEVGDDYSAKFYDANHNEISSEEYYKLANADGTWNDYTQAPIGTEEKTYQSAYYNRLVKAADGIDAHDAVVMEQLTPYTKSNASNIGSNLKTYTVGDDGETITESDATEEQQKANKDAWGQALGAGTFTTGTSDKATDASTSDQLVTGKTLYDYDKPTGSTNYVKVNNTTGQNLSALDAQVKANADTLNDSTHNIKYYSVNSTNTPTFGLNAYTNEKNDGASGRASLAAGFITHADGLASTVAGSYSGIYNKGTVSGTDFRGAAALSLGTVNINRNTDTTKPYSGVANSLIGQANVTTDSNAAIILGAGNTVKDSYRTISNLNLSGDMTAALKEAVPGSGGQVMVMGGGNSVENAYMTQVTGVGNTVTGSGDAYDADKSSQLNYVEGFYTTLTNGKNDYLIGAHNTVTGDSTDTNKSNIVFGDNHTLTNTKNNIIVGSADNVDTTTVSDVVSIGHNAKVTKEGGVAIGSGSEATTAAGVAGYDPTGATADTTAAWTSKKAAVSVGTADETRQITGVAAGKEETDAVNVAQLKKLNGMKANVNADNIGKNLNHKADGTTVTDEDKTVNENAWGAAIGTGSIAADNGQLVTGKTVYEYNKPVAAEGKTLNYISDTMTTGQNLTALDTQIKTNADNIGTNTTNISNNTENITNLKNLSNITEAGQTVIKNLAKGSIGMEDGSHTSVSHRDVNGVETYKVDVTVDGQVAENNTGIVNGGTVYSALQDVKNQTSADLANKANVDASNIGKNLNHKADGTAVTDEDKTVNENAWGAAIGTGSIAADNGQLVTGKTVYAYNKPVAAEGKTLNYVSDTKTTGQNLGSLDAQVGTNTGDISNLKNLSNISSAGETVIKNLAKGSIGMEDGSHTSVSHRDVNGVDTYKVDVTVDGQVAENNTGIVNGGTVYSALQDVKNQTSADLANKANVDASNLTPDNVTKWQEKLGNGEVVSGNKGLVTGDTVFKAVDTKANRDGSNLTDEEADSFSEKIARGEVKAGENRAVSGDAVSQAISKVTGDMNTQLDGKANTSLDNITKDGQTVIKKLSQDAVQVKAGDDHITIDAKTDETTGNKTYTISAKDGKVASGDTGLISGGTLYNEVHVDKDGSYIRSGNTVGQNLSALDSGLKTTSDLIHTNTKGDTIQIGGNSTATKIDVSGKDKDGNTTGRVITGIVTDGKDLTSAANVGYVNGITSANTQQIYRDMNNAYSRLDTNINRAAAGSNALAALHPLDFDPADKASFAVGYGHYHNANAAAIGAFYQPNANTMVNMGISLGNGDPGFNAGVSFKLGKGSAYNGVSKAEMAQTIHDQAEEISAIKANDAAKDKRIDALEKENQEMKKQIQEILSRLNG